MPEFGKRVNKAAVFGETPSSIGRKPCNSWPVS